ncbi:MAG: hypothetical protein K0Q72_2132 [Armatimonadetes bacterium]|nr:hypothetical protein [Armatimonadota bacterium]
MQSRWIRPLITGAVMLAWAAAVPAPSRSASTLTDPMRVTFFALDRGEATLVELPDRKHVLIGGGAPDEGARIIRALTSRGVRSLDLAVVQTWKEGHLGGLAAVLKRITAAQVYSNARYADTPSAAVLAKVVDYTTRSNRTYMRSPGIGESTSLLYNPVCRFTAVSPTGRMLAETRQDANCSMAYEISREKVSFLSLGDTTTAHQKAFWADTRFRPWGHILQIGRNGAANALLPSLLKPLRTRIAVIPVARKAGAVPAPALLAALKKAGVAVYRTDRNGNITISTDGKSFQVTTER